MGNILPRNQGWEGDDRYLQVEFRLMDTDKDGLLSTGELIKLLLALGFGGDEEKTELLLKEMNKERDDTISEDEYVEAVKSNEEILIKTSKLRAIFGSFDDTNDGKVSKSKIKKGLRVMEYDVDEAMEKAIEETDSDKDGFVTYDEFLGKHLKNKGFIPK
ncbi:calmodulin-4-like [Argopecten irradians]|uniref:calmodulin-4-like n=1 Tax=Argopecten irradians TaxID=31199 RepID=UPI003715CD32